jgi:hypothetical protein
MVPALLSTPGILTNSVTLHGAGRAEQEQPAPNHQVAGEFAVAWLRARAPDASGKAAARARAPERLAGVTS